MILLKTVTDPCTKTEGHTVEFKLDQFMQLQNRALMQYDESKYIMYNKKSYCVIIDEQSYKLRDD